MSFSLLPVVSEGDPKRILVDAVLLSKSFGEREIFSGVSFKLLACDKIFLVGPNGCGKSTLLSILLGDIEDFGGNVKINPKARFAAMGQHVSFYSEEKTVLQEFVERSELSEGSSRNILAKFGFKDVDCFKQIGVLSGGERSRLFLACLMQEMPDVLFLDEPTNHLDIPSREILESALSEYKGAILAVSHDRYFIERCAGKILGFVNGSVKEFDSYSLYRADEQKRKTSRNNDLTNIDMTISDKSVSPAAMRRNKAEERRHLAYVKEQIRALEKQISGFEEEKALLESSFNADTTPAEFTRYADILAMIEKSYEEYMELQDQ